MAYAGSASRTLFVVLNSSNPTALGAKIKEKYGSDALQLQQGGQWLVVGEGTAKDVCDLLGITDGTTGTAVVVTSAGYFGRSASDVWEWIVARMKATAA